MSVKPWHEHQQEIRKTAKAGDTAELRADGKYVGILYIQQCDVKTVTGSSIFPTHRENGIGIISEALVTFPRENIYQLLQ